MEFHNIILNWTANQVDDNMFIRYDDLLTSIISMIKQAFSAGLPLVKIFFLKY